MQSAAVLPALGIGDALLMMIASHHLKKSGYQVTTYHNDLPQLSSWFPGQHIQPLPSRKEHLLNHDLILVENDNSATIQELIQTARNRLWIFYPTYRVTKHPPLAPCDQVFNPDVSMADNIAVAISSLLNLSSPSKDNGLTPPPSLIAGSKQTQVLIHPTSREATKNWKASGFLQVARSLKQKGFSPLFCVGPNEHMHWTYVEGEGFSLGNFPTLADLAAAVYASRFVIGNDSLIGHLASNLGILSLIIAHNERHMRLWRPGWLPGQLVLPPQYLPNWKVIQNNWQQLISAKRVMRSFEKLSSII